MPAVDVASLPPEQQPQAAMFLTMVDSMPTEALEMLVGLLQGELEARRDQG